MKPHHALENMILTLYWLGHLETGLQPFALFYSPKLLVVFLLYKQIFATPNDSDDSCSALHRKPVAWPFGSHASSRLLCTFVWIKVLQKCHGSQVGLLSLMLCSLGKERQISLAAEMGYIQCNSFISVKRKTCLKLSFTGRAVAPDCSS